MDARGRPVRRAGLHRSVSHRHRARLPDPRPVAHRSEERRVGNQGDWSSDVCSSDLIGYLLLALALAGFVRDTNARRASLIDAAIVLVAAASMVWTLVVDPYVEQGFTDPSAIAIALVYPILDLLLIDRKSVV